MIHCEVSLLVTQDLQSFFWGKKIIIPLLLEFRNRLPEYLMHKKNNCILGVNGQQSGFFGMVVDHD